MTGVVLTVIIPAYNAEKYLPQCLDSVIGQTLKDIEVICVDDGSTDGSASVLQAYAQKDSRISVLTQGNSGQSAARNRALEKAKGAYVQFLDADDWLDPDCCRVLSGQAAAGKLDMLSMAAVSYEEESGRYVREPFYNFYYLTGGGETALLSRDECLQHWWEMAPSAALTIYRTDFCVPTIFVLRKGSSLKTACFSNRPCLPPTESASTGRLFIFAASMRKAPSTTAAGIISTGLTSMPKFMLWRRRRALTAGKKTAGFFPPSIIRFVCTGASEKNTKKSFFTRPSAFLPNFPRPAAGRCRNRGAILFIVCCWRRTTFASACFVCCRKKHMRRKWASGFWD